MVDGKIWMREDRKLERGHYEMRIPLVMILILGIARSEERRVGKECSG